MSTVPTTNSRPGWLVGAVLAITGIVAIIASWSIPPDGEGGLGARVFPVASALMLICLGAADSWARREQHEHGEAGNRIGVAALLLLSALYILALQRVGFLLSTAMVMPVTLALYGVRSRLLLIIGAIITPVAFHLFFFRMLGVFPPTAAWFDLADHLPL